MPEAGIHGAGTAELVTPIKINDVFDDPGAIRRLVERNGPYRTMASYLPESAVRGGPPAAFKRPGGHRCPIKAGWTWCTRRITSPWTQRPDGTGIGQVLAAV
jgi:hypothetical protein